jgi:hypothetical protein
MRKAYRGYRNEETYLWANVVMDKWGIEDFEDERTTVAASPSSGEELEDILVQ